MEDWRIDPVAEGMDLIVRVGSLQDSSLIAKRAGRAPISVYAAPELLKTLKNIPQTIAELMELPVIGWIEKFGAPSGKELILVSNALLAKGAALKGAGFALLPDYLAAEDVATGRLERVLPYADNKGAEIALLHAFGLTPPLRVRTFMQFAVELWRKTGDVI
jgi:DNA-binding transcriptional LysR family regulator